MPPPPHTRPENVLKRAQELIGVGQQQAALAILHEHVTSKRTRNSTIAALEPVMLLFVELCVDLRKGKSAKDGLYNYKNTSQNTNVATIELVFRKFIELAEQKVKEAQAKSDEISAQGDAETKEPTESLKNVDDLESMETPESILLSTVSGEQSKDRTDRAIVTPWLKFLWETYRTVLDIFKNNARLEVMYQTTAHQAFNFCLRYTRKTEFRRLCELLRNHLQNAAKYSQQVHAINLSEPETLQRHLDTRFMQLNVAVELELWQEAFKSVEDIHILLNLSKRAPKNVMMANYFEKLTKIFLVSENYLFHAAAWSRYYNLLLVSARAVAAGAPRKENPSNIADADLSKAASFVLLSALAIPVISTSRSRGALIDVDAARSNKNARLTNLLAMSTPPTRSILFKDALHKDILQRARPEIRNLYNILETDFHPKSILAKVSPILSQIGADEEMSQYIVPLQQVILTRLFQQLSQVYTDVKLADVLALAQFPSPFEVDAAMIEKFIMNGCKKGDLSIRVDHSTGVLSFDSDVFSSSKSLSGAANEDTSIQRLQSTPAEIVRTQLSRLSKALYVAVQYVDPAYNADRHKSKLAALKRAEAGAQKSISNFWPEEIITKKKETALSIQAAKTREEEQRKRAKQQELQAAETARLAQETKEQTEKQLKELQGNVKGVDISSLDIDELDTGRIRAIKLQALEREKNEMSEKVRITAKRIDHLERSYRLEEAKKLPEDLAAQHKQDYEAWEATKKETLETALLKHKEDVSLKHRLSRLVGAYEGFRKDITQQRQAEFEKRRKAAERELQAKMDQRRKDVLAEREAARKRAEEEARREKEEEARRLEEEEQAAAAAEAKRIKDAESKAEAEARRAERAESARKQQEREAEAEQRRLERRGQAPRPVERAPESGPPRLQLAGGKPSWRDRQAAKEDEPEKQPSGYVPPGRRDDAPKSGYVPPGRRGDEEAPRSGYVPPARRGDDEAPKSGYVPPGRRDDAPRWQPKSRQEEGAEAPRRTEETPRWQPRARPAEESSDANAAPPAAPPAARPGKYVPPSRRG
ncbi:hypothetical protein AMS68_003113 [Peltaster fructicola]|uniref:Eukaryotic translation initiation factor 3 subunit A n=1 Tax=Peltaster fructicola TaxID=286661 RepID=A0A6H0XSE4_9PEZI|nr:hypothetical protein AMS68_003113 [Peltaster fructicola]